MSILTTNILAWFGHISQRDIKKLESVIRSADCIIDTKLPPSPQTLCQQRARIEGILNDNSHTTRAHFKFLPSGHRLQTFK